MKRIFWTILVTAFVLAATGCGATAPATPIPTVSLGTIESTFSTVKASAVAVPRQEARLSFVIGGSVADVSVKAGEQVQAGQTLVQLDTTTQEFDIVSAQAALDAAKIDAQIERRPRRRFDMNTFSFVYESAPPEKIQAADAKVDQMQSALDAAEASLAQATLVAPFDGTVVSVKISKGEYVQPGQVIIELAKLDDLKIETTDLSELNVATVKVGQSASVYVEALDNTFPGKVTTISPISNTLGGDVVFTVTIQLDEQPKELLWGMSADVDINVE